MKETKGRREEGSTVAQAYVGFLGIDAVEDALVSNLALGGQAYQAPDVGVRRRPRSGCLRRHRRRLPGGGIRELDR